MASAPLDVIVVGAGVSGLAAARELHQSGLRIAILEGRERLRKSLSADERELVVESGATALESAIGA